MRAVPSEAAERRLAPETLRRRRAFAEAYVSSGCDVEAASRAAGYPHSAPSLLEKPEVRAMIRSAQDRLGRQLRRTHDVTRDRLVSELSCLAFSDAAEAAEWFRGTLRLRDSCELPSDVTRAIASVSRGKDGIAFKMVDKLGALAMLARLFGWIDPTRVSVVQSLSIGEAPRVQIMIPSNGREVEPQTAGAAAPTQAPLTPAPDPSGGAA